MSVKTKIIAAIEGITASYTNGQELPVLLEIPTQSDHGDYSTNIAMILGKKVGRNPVELAEDIAKQFRVQRSDLPGGSASPGEAGLKIIEKVEVVKPGFINFFLSKKALLDALQQDTIVNLSSSLRGKKIMVEYAHPNTHKEMHIGHMRTLITGEAICRLFEAARAKVFRANYQGDIGPHVAKALYGIEKILQEKKLTLSEVEGWDNKAKAHFLGEGYVRGSKDYEEHKDEIDGINAELYSSIGDASSVIASPEGTKQSHNLPGDSPMAGKAGIAASSPEASPRNDKMRLWDLYQLTRQWSLDYYEEFYTRFYTKFDQLFFESEMVEKGKKIVEENIGKVFVRENGAIIFPGEKYGLHTRVFITQAANPTYEGKEMGNGYAEYEAFPFDLKMHIVASEQAGYFQVVFKALDLIDPEKFAGKQHHLSMGMVTLTDPSGEASGQARKMSSRTGDILTVDWLIDQVRERVEQLAKEGKIQAEKREETIEMITIGAIKYSVLRGGTGQNVAFDIEKSVSLDGNSGPYLQYTYARTRSVLAKSEVRSKKSEAISNFPSARAQGEGEIHTSNVEPEELALLRKVYQFEDIVVGAAENYAPNHVATYLFELAQLFNLFYQKHKVIGSEQEIFRLTLTRSVGNTLQKGLDLLGIQAPEKM
ncbi:MAG: arginine--tRNA ligase [bacterium]|nr:arginine--tRNA ligase [bacterium]